MHIKIVKLRLTFSTFIFFLSCKKKVISHPYEVDVYKENVILGNDALMKCIIPSFVADLVIVDSWLDVEENREIRTGTLHVNGKIASKKEINHFPCFLYDLFSNHTKPKNLKKIQLPICFLKEHEFSSKFWLGVNSEIINRETNFLSKLPFCLV